MNTTYSTRVQAPNSHVEDQLSSDLVTLKPHVGGVIDDVQLTLKQPNKNIKLKIQKNTNTKYNKIQKNSCGGVISCRSETVVGTLNVRTVREYFKRLELATLFLRSQLTVLGIQEHRVVHDEEIKIEKHQKGVHLITSSAWRNSVQASTGGVGFMLTKNAYNAISLIKTYGKRILLVSFDGNPRLTMVSVYSPTECSSKEEAEEFHDNLRVAIKDVPAHHLLMVVGDLNAHLSKLNEEDTGWYWHKVSNRNGGLLRDTILEGQLEATNHRFQKKPGKLWTHLSDGTLTKSQIDYILVRKKWRSSVKNTEACNSFNSLGSDHRVVLSSVKLSLRKSKRPPQVARYNYDPLKTDEDLQSRYAVEVRNRFNMLLEQESETDDVTSRYKMLADSVQDTNKKLLKLRPRKRRDDPAGDNRVEEARNILFDAKDKYHLDPCEETRQTVKEKKDVLAHCYRTVEEETLKRKIYSAENAADRCKNKESWDLINDITGRKKKSCGLVEGGSAEGRLKSWKDHFTKLLGQAPSVPDEDVCIPIMHPTQDISVAEFSKGELEEARKMIKEGKAFGEDGVAPEILKRVDIDDLILDFCNKALIDSEIPDQWKHLNIVPVPKKGNLSKVDNYRGIALTSIVSKTLNRMILNRIKPAMEKILRINQNGFREGRSTTSHILCLRRILEGARDRNLSALILFVDFKKAFDSVHRGLLMKILTSYGIPQPIVRLIERMYENTIARVITDDGLTEAFLILAGVMQGDTLAPYLFIIVIDYIMTNTLKGKDTGFTLQPRRSRRHPAVKICDVDFADDLALVTNTADEAQSLLLSLEHAASEVGLHLNEDKTKFIGLNLQEDDVQDIRAASGKEIKRVEDFVYLGSRIMKSEKDFEVRKAKAWGACHKLKTIWKSGMRRDLKIRLFVATVESILLYGSETWTISQSLATRINGCYSRMLRMALNIHWSEKVSNAIVFGNLRKPSVKIAERRLKLAGHLARHDDLLANQVLFWSPQHGYRGRGRPHLTYLDMLQRDTGLYDSQEIKNLMLDRKVWRDVITARTKEPT